jgi:hypothetical protein
LVVVPSAPVLVDLATKPALRGALLGADLAITDSGLMVLMWWLLKREKLERVSGLEYLKLLLQELRAKGEGQSIVSAQGATGAEQRSRDSSLSAPCSMRSSSVFWVMPTEAARDQNLAWLRSQGFATTAEDCYVAPMYGPDGPISDLQLLAIIQQRKPAHIILALGGGVQERLGFALREALRADSKGQRIDPQVSGFRSQVSAAAAYRPGIHCIGAAIGFLSGEQVRIPMWVDYLYLGWLWRSVSAPTKFVPRYWKAMRLVGLIFRYREKPPVAENQG